MLMCKAIRKTLCTKGLKNIMMLLAIREIIKTQKERNTGNIVRVMQVISFFNFNFT